MKDENTLAEEIKATIADKSFFCNPEASLSLLSIKLNSNPTYISKIIHFNLKSSFKYILNYYRIKHYFTIATQTDYKKYKIDQIIKECGFKSKSNFYRNLKEIKKPPFTSF